MVQHGAHGATGTAPFRPEIHQHGDGGLLCDLAEVVVARIDNPRKPASAVGTPRFAVGGRGNAVGLSALRAFNDCLVHGAPAPSMCLPEAFHRAKLLGWELPPHSKYIAAQLPGP